MSDPTSAIDLAPNARRILEARYLLRDDGGELRETPDELFRRVARGVAHAEILLHGPDEAERWEERFHELLTSLTFLPNSPTLMNAGTELGQLSGCFVLPVPDSMEGIFQALKEMALIQQSGGGTGFAFSRLRPRGALVHSTGGRSSGPVSFMEVFNCATEQIEQGGKRRGANMGVLRVDHPDIDEFIDAKLAGDTLRNFNISVAASDEFMEAAAAGHSYVLRDPRDGRQVERRDAESVLRRISEAAWKTGDPGLFFIDIANRAHPLPHLGELEATNPCGEIPLLPYESCNLGSLNLARFVRNEGNRGGGRGIGGGEDDSGEGTENRKAWANRTFDRDAFGDAVRTALRFLDDIVEVNRYPLEATADITRANRKVGLGVMGFAEALVRLGISYDSDEAEEFADEVARLLTDRALEASQELAEERGVFPNWEGSRHHQEGRRVRNATRTAIAPTGTIGIIADTSPSIEPFFSLAYRRTHVLSGETLRTVNPLLETWAESYGVDVDRLMKDVRRTGSLEGMEELPDPLRELFVTAQEIPPRRHLAVQAAFQRHIDNAVSKTINLPEDARVEDVMEIYREAWELGLKGITVFRYGSKGSQVLKRGAEGT